MFSLSALGLLIGGALLVMSSYKEGIDTAKWQEAVDTVRLDRPNPGVRVKGIECSRRSCEYHDLRTCQKPYTEYCGFE